MERPCKLILAVESLLFSIFFFAQEIFGCLGTNNLWKIINNKVTFKKAIAHFPLKQTSMLSGFAFLSIFGVYNDVRAYTVHNFHLC